MVLKYEFNYIVSTISHLKATIRENPLIKGYIKCKIMFVFLPTYKNNVNTNLKKFTQ